MEKAKVENDVHQHEDGVLKTATKFFAEEMLTYFNIEGKVVGFAPTEEVVLELHKMFQDFNLVMEDGSWKHFEFQSTDGGETDLKRFRMYEATASYHNGVDVTTYVLYSGEIQHPVTVIKTGANIYQVIPIIMQDDSADEVIENLQKKLKKHEKIEKGDLIPLILTPLMSGEMSQKERIRAAFSITRSVVTIGESDLRKIEAMVYAMADKFLESGDLEKIKEEIKMTRLGAMLYEDGIGVGIERGERQKLKTQIEKKMKKGYTVAEIADLLEEDVEVVRQISKEL